VLGDERRWINVACRIPFRSEKIIIGLDDHVCFSPITNVEVGKRDRIPEGFAPVLVRLGVFAVALNFPLAVIYDVVVGPIR
jgi:hypothetical protein